MKRFQTPIIQEMMEILKLKCRVQGITQLQLAEKVGVSLPTLKRWFSGKGLSLENLILILEELGLTLSALTISLEEAQQQNFHYTLMQEEFFAQRPEFLGYFDQLLSGKKPKEIEQIYKLSPKTTQNYLNELQNLQLIEVLPYDNIKFLVHGTPVWRKNGKLTQQIGKNALDDFVKEANAENNNLKFLIHD